MGRRDEGIERAHSWATAIRFWSRASDALDRGTPQQRAELRKYATLAEAWLRRAKASASHERGAWVSMMEALFRRSQKIREVMLTQNGKPPNGSAEER